MESHIKEYQAPINYFRRLISKDDSDHFTFKINIFNANHQQPIIIQTTINKARVISQNVNKIYEIDPTIIEYELKIPQVGDLIDIHEIEKVFQNLLESAQKTIKIEQNQAKLFHILQYLLGNDDQNENQLFITNIKEAISLLNTSFHDASIKYLSSKFQEFIKDESFINISDDIIKNIIDLYFTQTEQKNDSKEIFKKMREYKESANLILYFMMKVSPKEFDEEMIKYFYSELNDEIIRDEMSRIVAFLREHILLLISSFEKQRKIYCEFCNDELDGIISYLSKNNEKVNLSFGGEESKNFPISNIIKYDSKFINEEFVNNRNSFAPKQNQSWIEFDFAKRKINVSSYTIRSNSCIMDDDGHPKSWRIEGSNDKTNWDLIDKKENDSYLNGKYNQHRFICQNKNNSYYQYIRYVQDDSWYTSRDYKYKIRLSCFEFFGSIKED